MDESTRESICAAAVRAARSVDYVGAGTIEFIADASEGLRADRIWFMEMNTRLQVEHPVTEAITGVDLVEWQLRVASGEKLPKRQDELRIDGWAIEARLYAEDPAKGFLPSVGRLERFYLCDYSATDRVETGVEEGDVISPYYDPMIAKLVCHGTDREDARASLLEVLARSYVAPVKSNGGFIYECLSQKDFIDGAISTDFIVTHGAELEPLGRPSDDALSDAASNLIAVYPAENTSHFEVRNGHLGFRLNQPRNDLIILYSNGLPIRARYEALWVAAPHGFGYSYAIDDQTIALVERGQTFLLSTRAPTGAAAGAAADGALLAPMPGRVTAVDVAPGAAVAKGQRLVTLEAMKMEHALTAPFDGTVAELPVTAGQQVSEGALLVRVAADPE
jgi:3-methylcrotonyl-CoA carboxylase alpha subunit